tara:strand:+ start:68 stop:805 length:738 start_codon:yes stop_codon:yes gene_type:complete
MKKTLITITGNWTESHSKNWIECESTWVPKLREKGFEVLILMSNPHLDKDYEKIGNFFFSKCGDSMDYMYLKNHYYISKYLLDETDYDYRFHTDSDSFIHPERFIEFLEDYTTTDPQDYVGCAIPYPQLNPQHPHKYIITDPNRYASGGSGFLLSRKSHSYMVNDFFEEEHETLYCCDKITGQLLRANGINLFHDSRLLFESKYKTIMVHHNGNNNPHIGDKDSFLAVQHFCNGHMQEIINELGI